MTENILVGIFSESFWYIAPILVTLVTAITGKINSLVEIKRGWVKQVISWGVSGILSAGAWLAGFVILGEPVWLSMIALGIVVGLSSNGFYDIPVIKNFVKRWL